MSQNGFASWRVLLRRFSLPGAAQNMHCGPMCWNTGLGLTALSKTSQHGKCRGTGFGQTQTQLLDSIMVATVLTKKAASLQQHLRLNKCETSCIRLSTNGNRCAVAKRTGKNGKEMVLPWLGRKRKHERKWQNWPPWKIAPAKAKEAENGALLGKGMKGE